MLVARDNLYYYSDKYFYLKCFGGMFLTSTNTNDLKI